MVLAVEIIVCCLIFGIYRVIRIKRDPAYKISNMPEKLQKKVMHMRGYRNRNIRIMTDWEKFVKKLPALIFWTIALVILTSIAGATSFSTGFVFALLIWMAVLLFLELVVYCGWYAHTPKVWIKGTEDMAKKTYTNYAHYIGLIPQRALMGIIVAIIVGLVIDVIPRLDNNNYSPKYTEIEDTLKAACDNYRIPGMAVEVVDAEGVLFSGTYGECKSLDTPFITGSLSKSFTAACIMKLYEGGHLNIDSPVNPYLDAAEVFKNPKDATRITIRQLLNHTSGLGVYQHVGNAKIVGKNGEYTYANVNYDILGLIVEKVSGVSYSDYLTETFFTPLGMTHSSAAYAKAKEDGLITGHNNYFGFSVESDVKAHIAREFQRQPSPAIDAHIPIVRADGYARVVQHGGKRPRLHHGVRLPRTAFAGLADFRLDARVVQARIRVALPTVVGKPLEAVIRPVQPVVFVENGLPISKKGFRHALRLLFTLPRGR